MNILIAKELKISNSNLQLHFNSMWEDSKLFEAESLNKVIKDVFDTKFELIILHMDMEDNDKWSSLSKRPSDTPRSLYLTIIQS